MFKKILFLKFTLLVVTTFLYSQVLWASGYPVFESINPSEIQKPNNFLPSDLQEIFSKDSCRISVKPTDFSNFEVFLALADPYNLLQIHTQSVLNNEIGDIAYEKVKVEAEQGWGPFESETEVLTEYKYGYDQYGQYEKTWENEIYREVSSNPLGKIIEIVVTTIATIYLGL